MCRAHGANSSSKLMKFHSYGDPIPRSVRSLPQFGTLHALTGLARTAAFFGSAHVRFSNRPFEVKHFQTIHHCSVDVAHGLVLLFGLGARALPSWDSRTRRNNLLRGLTVRLTIGPSGHAPLGHLLLDGAESSRPKTAGQHSKTEWERSVSGANRRRTGMPEGGDA